MCTTVSAETPAPSRGRLRLGIEIAKLEAVVKAEGDEIAADLRELLQLTWDDRSRKAIEEALLVFEGAGDGAPATPADTEAVLEALRDELGEAYAEEVAAGLRDSVEEAYDTAAQQALDQGLMTFDLSDDAARAWLKDHHTYWVREHFDEHTQARVQAIGDEVIEEGLGRYAAGQRFQEKLGPALGQSQTYWQHFANSVTTRSQEFGRLSRYEKAGAEAYEISAVIDDRTSALCRALDGTVIQVSDGIQQRDRLMQAESPEAVKEIAPWRSAEEITDGAEDEVGSVLGSKELAEMGVGMPPYHFGCRTRTVIHTE